MHIRRKFLILTHVLATAIVSTMAFQTTPSFAVGDIHLIIIRSTTDPSIRKAGKIWQERLEETLATGKTPDYTSYGYPESLEAATAPGGLGKSDVKTYLVLDGEGAHPENIMKTCLKVSHDAGSDDAIMVFIMSHGGIQKGNDNVIRQGFSPVAISDKESKFSSIGIHRETILKCLTHEIDDGVIKEKPHRLVALISDSCGSPIDEPLPPPSTSPSDNAQSNSYDSQVVPSEVLVPHDVSYLKKFLQEARGVVNINSCNNGETAIFIGQSPVKEFEGSLFINAFCRFATNGFYLEGEKGEINKEDFYKLLRIEYTRERQLYQEMRHKNPQEKLTQYEGSVSVDPKTTPYEQFDVKAYEELYDARKDVLKKSGQFQVKKIGGIALPPGVTADGFPL